MEATEVVWTQVLATFAADTGSGGLNDNTSTGAAKVRQFIRSGDAAELSVNDYPSVVVGVSTDNRGPVTANCQFFEGVINFVITAQRDPGNGGITSPDNTIARATLDAVLSRILALYDGTKFSALTDTDDGARKWYFSKMIRIALGSLQSTSSRLRQPVSYRLYVNKGLT